MPDARTSPLLGYLRKLLGVPAGQEVSDGELLHAFVTRRDESSFALLLGRHGPMVLGVCRGLLSEQDAEDAFQATFLALVRKAASVRRGESLAGWLYQVAYRAARKARAQSARRAFHERQAMDAFTEPAGDPAEAASWRDLRPVLAEEVGRLPAKYRTPVVLCYVEGKTHEEAARALGWPTGTVAGRLSRAREMLRGRLVRRGVALPAGVLAARLVPAAAPAALPDALAGATLRAALRLASGEALAGVVSARVVSLTEGVLQTMSVTRLKFGVLMLLTLGLLGTGGGLLARRALSGPPPAEVPEARRAPAPPADRPEPRPADARPWRELAVGKRGMTGVDFVLFAPDGKTLVTAGSKPSGKGDTLHTLAIVWDASTGKHLLTLPEAGAGLAFSPDGKLLAVCDLERGSVKLLDTRTWKERAAWDGLEMDGEVEFSPDGKMLVGGYCAYSGKEVASEVRWWDVAAGKERGRLKGDGKLGYLAHVFSPDSRTLAVLDTEGRVRLLDARGGKERGVLRGEAGFAGGLLFSPDGKTLATWMTRGGAEAKDQDRSVTLWAVAGRKRRALLKGHTAPVLTAAFSPDGKTLATGGEDGAVKLWDVARGKERASRTFTKPAGGRVQFLSFSRDGKVLAASGAGVDRRSGQLGWLTKFWDVAGGKERAVLPRVRSVTFSPRGKAVALVYGDPLSDPRRKPDEVKVWDLARLLERKAKE